MERGRGAGLPTRPAARPRGVRRDPRGVGLSGAALVLGLACQPIRAPRATEGDPTDGTTSHSTTSAPDDTATMRVPEPLIDHAAWAPVDAAEDPIPSHRPTDVQCGPVGAYPEGTGYEVDTGLCNYCARWQPSLVEIRAGDTLMISAFHETLASIEAGQAHVALLLTDWPVWQEFIPIPASPGVVDATPFNEQIVVDVDVPVGTPVGLHLHNHGYNTWTLLSVEVVPPTE